MMQGYTASAGIDPFPTVLPRFGLMPPLLQRARRIVYSCFIVANLAVVIYCNLPASIGRGIGSDLSLIADHYRSRASTADQDEYRREYRKWWMAAAHQQLAAHANWRIRQYAHYAGLDNRWQMFGRQSRFNWWYVFKGYYTDGERAQWVALATPRQSKYSGVPRTFWEYHFFDFREGKFHLNMYREPLDRAAYARYLARQFPTHDDLPIQWVVIELHYQNINSPDEARRTGSHLDSSPYTFTYNAFTAQGEIEPIRGAYSLPNLAEAAEH